MQSNKDLPWPFGYGSLSAIFSVDKFFRLLVILLIFCYVVNAAVFQLEMWLTGGFIPIYPSWITLLVGLYLVFGLFHLRPRTSLMLPVSLLLIYAVLDGLFLHFSANLSFDEIHLALEYIIMIALLGLTPSIGPRIREKEVYWMLALFLIPCAIVSLAQSLTGLPVLPVQSLDGSFQAVNYLSLGGQLRAFSLFFTAIEAGIFYCFTGALGAALIMRKKAGLTGPLLCVGSAFLCYATQTRLALVAFAFIVPAAFAMHTRFKRTLLFLPIISLVVAVMVIVQGLGLTSKSSGPDLADTSSLEDRLIGWSYYSSAYLGGNVAQMAFGQGIGSYESDTPQRRANAAIHSIDNGYLEILVSSGAVGLMLVVFFYYRAWRLIYLRAIESDSALVWAVASCFAAVPLLAMIDDFPISIMMLSIFAVSSSEERQPDLRRLCTSSATLA